MIKKSFLPIDFAVAIGALSAQTALMFIVFLVASETIRRRIAKFNFWLMTIAANHFRIRVTALKHEIRELMIEGFFVDGRDVHGAAFMLGMTNAAFLFLDAPMKSAFLTGVLGHVFVTIEA